MATVSSGQIAGYRRRTAALEQAIRNELQALWRSVAGLPNDRVKAILVDAVPALIDKYGSMSAAVAAEWFEELIDSPAYIPDLYSPDAYAATTRWAISPLYKEQAAPSEAFAHLLAGASRHVKNYGRSVIDGAVARTPGTYFARVPSGATTCEFCLVMASRGPVYSSRETAKYRARDGAQFHDECDCVAVPMRGQWIQDVNSERGWRWEGDTVAGYRFEQMYDLNYKPFHSHGADIKTVVARMREARTGQT